MLLHIGQVFWSLESSFSIQVKCLPLQLCRQCVPLSLDFQNSNFLETGITESIAATKCLKSYNFGKEIIKALCSVVITTVQQQKMFLTFTLLYWSDIYWRQQISKYNGITLLKATSLTLWRLTTTIVVVPHR